MTPLATLKLVTRSVKSIVNPRGSGRSLRDQHAVASSAAAAAGQDLTLPPAIEHCVPGALTSRLPKLFAWSRPSNLQKWCMIARMRDKEKSKPPGDLFRSGDNWKLNACVNFVRDDWSLYAEGFHMGAEALIRGVVDSRGQSIDFLIYPIAFCYRHAIELQLKAAVHWGRKYLGESSPTYPHGHTLASSQRKALWEECRSIAERVWPEGPQNELDDVEKILLESETHDPIGQAFRYPVDSKGIRTKADLTHINLQEFHAKAESAYKLLDGISTGCQAMWEQRMENVTP